MIEEMAAMAVQRGVQKTVWKVRLEEYDMNQKEFRGWLEGRVRKIMGLPAGKYGVESVWEKDPHNAPWWQLRCSERGGGNRSSTSYSMDFISWILRKYRLSHRWPHSDVYRVSLLSFKYAHIIMKSHLGTYIRRLVDYGYRRLVCASP